MWPYYNICTYETIQYFPTLFPLWWNNIIIPGDFYQIQYKNVSFVPRILLRTFGSLHRPLIIGTPGYVIPDRKYAYR